EWRGWVNLGNWNANTDFDIMDSGLLEKAVEKDLAGLSRENDDSCSPKLDDVVPTAVDLGKLGIGIITNVHASCACTLRWVCPIYVYAREKDSYRLILNSHSDDRFALVESKTGIPDIVLTEQAERQE